MPEDVVHSWTRFKTAGLATRTKDNALCCYALQDKVWVEDPDGNVWDEYQVLPRLTWVDEPWPSSWERVFCSRP